MLDKPVRPHAPTRVGGSPGVTCRIYCRLVDERTGRIHEELVAVLEDDLSPHAALSAFFAEHDPPAGTYTASCRLGTATVTYDGGRR